jgi:hypothetical protein
MSMARAELREQEQQGGPLRVDPTFGELIDGYLDWYQREVDAGVPAAESVVAAARTIATVAGDVGGITTSDSRCA